MKALVLAAGLGTRLRPLTLTVPKPLVPVLGRPVVEPLLEWLSAAGLTTVGINTHWLPEQLRAHLGDGGRWGVELQWRHEPVLLEGAGTLKSFEELWAEDTVVAVNGDVVLELDLSAALAAHERSGAALTLVVSPYHGPLARPVAWAADGRLVGIRRHGLDDPAGVYRGEFTGVHLVEPEVWRRHIPRGRPCNLVGDVIPRLLARGVPVACHLAPGLFADIGDPDSLARAERLLLERRPARYLSGAVEESFGVWCEPGARLLGSAIPPVYLGRGAVVQPGACVGPHEVIPPGQTILPATTIS